MKKTEIMSILKAWLPLAGLATVLCGTVYLAVQQDLRQTANDPQIQIAEDAANALAHGATPTQILGQSGQSDISTSLAAYMMMFSNNDKATVSTAAYGGKMFVTAPPAGTFNAAQTSEQRFTWEPMHGIRSAAVLVHYTSNAGSGYVLVGKSLREVEKRESSLELQVGLGYLTSLLVSLGLVYVAREKKPATK
jgi:hypothetical protein